MKIFKYILFSLLIIVSSTVANAQDDCFPKPGNQLVYDNTNTLSKDQIRSLNNKLVQFANSTSTQIAIVLVDDLCGHDKAQYTYTLAEKWGVGEKGKENGILIMVKPTGGSGQRRTFIATGYGLEGAIPDATAKRIVEKEMIPHFRSNDIYGGLVAATSVIMKLAEGEFSSKEYSSKQKSGNYSSILGLLFFTLIYFFISLTRARSYSKRNNMGMWAAFMLMSSSSRGRGGSFGGFSSGGFGGGFGGGSFGGGGASGGW